MKTAKNSEEARDIQEKFEGNPHGFIQWKGTDVCMDLYCDCGHHGHIDVAFAYHYQCPKCGDVFFISSHVELIKLQEKPEHCVVTCEL